MKKIFTILATFAVLITYGQTSKTALDLPDLQSRIIAENNFARLSKEKNTKEAFLSNLSDSRMSIVFIKGEPVNARQAIR